MHSTNPAEPALRPALGGERPEGAGHVLPQARDERREVGIREARAGVYAGVLPPEERAQSGVASGQRRQVGVAEIREDLLRSEHGAALTASTARLRNERLG